MKQNGEGSLPCAAPAKCMVKVGTQHRLLLDTEALFLQGYPRTLKLRNSSLPQAEAAVQALSATLKLPNIFATSLAIWLAISVARTTATSPDTRFAHFADEELLRDQVRDTCWDPVVAASFPGVLDRPTLSKEIASLFNGEAYAGMEWDIPVRNATLRTLQTFGMALNST